MDAAAGGRQEPVGLGRKPPNGLDRREVIISKDGVGGGF